MVPATSCIACVPVSRDRTSRARYSANRMAMMPAGRMISWRELASIRACGPPGVAVDDDSSPPDARRHPGRRSWESGSDGPIGHPIGAGTLQAGASVTRREKSGQTRSATLLCTGCGAPAGPGASPYTAPLVTPRRPMLGCLLEIAETLALTLIIFFVIQTFVAQPYKVQQRSMQHTLEPEEYVLVDKLTPRFDTYKRGDIVVFTPPPDWVQEDGTPFIKRAIGLGGATVDIRDGHVFINDTEITEPYLYADPAGSTPQATTVQGDQHAWVVAPGDVFLM